MSSVEKVNTIISEEKEPTITIIKLHHYSNGIKDKYYNEQRSYKNLVSFKSMELKMSSTKDKVKVHLKHEVFNHLQYSKLCAQASTLRTTKTIHKKCKVGCQINVGGYRVTISETNSLGNLRRVIVLLNDGTIT